MTLAHFRERIDRDLEISGKSELKHILFSNIRATVKKEEISKYPRKSKLPSCIIFDSVSGCLIEDILLSNISLTVHGGGLTEEANEKNIPEWTKDERPEAYLYNRVLPCVGLFARNTKDLEIINFIVYRQEKDLRPDIFIV